MGELRYYDADTFEDRGAAPIPETLEDRQRKIKNAEHRKSTDAFNVFIDKEYGSFYFLFYGMIGDGIEKQYIIRYLYLCSFTDYNSNLIFGSSSDDRKYMVESDLQEVLKLSKTELNRTKKAFKDNNLILIDDESHLKINNKYCLKGKIPRNRTKTNKIRIFENAIRELYGIALPREHKKIGLLMLMLPHINLKFNVVCENPKCELMSEIIPISLTKLAYMLGYDNKQDSVQRLKRGLFDIKIKNEFVIMINSVSAGGFVTINPRAYYKGGKYEDVTYLYNLFSIAEKL